MIKWKAQNGLHKIFVFAHDSTISKQFIWKFWFRANQHYSPVLRRFICIVAHHIQNLRILSWRNRGQRCNTIFDVMNFSSIFHFFLIIKVIIQPDIYPRLEFQISLQPNLNFIFRLGLDILLDVIFFRLRAKYRPGSAMLHISTSELFFDIFLIIYNTILSSVSEELEDVEFLVSLKKFTNETARLIINFVIIHIIHIR